MVFRGVAEIYPFIAAYFAENIEFAENRPHNLRKEMGKWPLISTSY